MAQDADGFHAYIKQTKNTICGRVPIGILLQVRSDDIRAGRCHRRSRLIECSFLASMCA